MTSPRTRWLRLGILAVLGLVVTAPLVAQDEASPTETPAPPTPTPEYASFGTPVPDAPLDLKVPDFSFPEAQAPPGMPDVTPAIPKRMVDEARGLFVISNARGIQSPGQIKELAGEVIVGEINRVYVDTRTVFGACYPSDLEASAPFISASFPNPILELSEQLAGKATVWSVVDVLPAFSANTGSKPKDNSPLGRFPALANVSVTGSKVANDNMLYLDPGHPQTKEYLVRLIEEIDTQVTPSGYLLRGLKYPGHDWGYSEGAVKAFRDVVGGSGMPPPDDPTWSAWRREQITQLLSVLKAAIRARNPNAKLAVLIETNAAPPTTWEDWIQSRTYHDSMQDWITWCRDNVIDEIVFEVHERTTPEKSLLPLWVNFANSNTSNVRPIVSISGAMNFRDVLGLQYRFARERGVGTILWNYAQPTRDVSRGFFASLPAAVFRGYPGRPLPGKRLTGPSEVRQFAMMSSPPASVTIATPTPIAFENPLDAKPLIFESPTPVPTPSPEPKFLPGSEVRKVTFTSGKTIEAIVLELTPTTITLKPVGSEAMILPRNIISVIDPPL